jgi:hypothetical protein
MCSLMVILNVWSLSALFALFFVRCGSTEGEVVVAPNVYIRFFID